LVDATFLPLQRQNTISAECSTIRLCDQAVLVKVHPFRRQSPSFAELASYCPDPWVVEPGAH
jgi:hypothetical protein